QYRLVSFLTGKARRLRQAKEEAQAEVEAYKRERERQYRENEAKILGSKGDMEKKIAISTQAKIEELNHSVAANKEKAVKRLLSLVCNIKPELHENYTASLVVAR
ncbi:hypothetical protein LSH36_327g00005, partial [Paralvinella palmiformis]